MLLPDPHLLRVARERAHLTQQQLGALTGSTGTRVSRIERGVESPTVRSLTVLLAACGLQARVTLEPLLAHVDAQVDELERRAEAAGNAPWAPAPESLAGLIRLVDSLEDRPVALPPAYTGCTARAR